jgi:TPP-dependent pyruvate/acetoin dehydrogenase alpha subunit
MPFDSAEAYERLLRIRRVEERMVELVDDKVSEGTVLHSGLCQEATPVGVAMAKGENDVLFSTHRGVAHCLAWGADLESLIAESIGRTGGHAGGLVGHMHIVDLERGIVGTNGIVGGGLPLAVGAAIGLQQQGSDGCAIAFFGDGAANTGAFHEALNMAAAWNVPAVFVNENNGIAEMTYSEPLTAGTVAGRGAAYGMHAEAIDGSDVLAVADAVAAALERARAGEGPSVIECRVHRALGHWIGDPQHYRDPEELDRFDEHDPLARLLGTGAVPAARVEEARERVELELEQTLARVLQQPRPEPADLFAPHLAR